MTGEDRRKASGMLMVFCILNTTMIIWTCSLCKNVLSCIIMIYALFCMYVPCQVRSVRSQIKHLSQKFISAIPMQKRREEGMQLSLRVRARFPRQDTKGINHKRKILINRPSPKLKLLIIKRYIKKVKR